IDRRVRRRRQSRHHYPHQGRAVGPAERGRGRDPAADDRLHRRRGPEGGGRRRPRPRPRWHGWDGWHGRHGRHDV
ncbi:MAG: Heat shock protein 60 family chaperone GroEL, partial [uncultured Phycisphaerae bacterium]